jgi:hypothetical protein
MARKWISGSLVALSAVFFGLSLAGIIAIWTYQAAFSQAIHARLLGADAELAGVQTDLQNARGELERTLRIVDSAEAAMTGLKNQLTQARELFGVVNGTLDRQLIPGLKASREKIEQAKSSLESLRASLQQLSTLPFFGISLPGDALLGDLIASAASIDAEIARVQDLAQKASTFAGDSAYLLGADFSETKQNLQKFLGVVNAYDLKIGGWRAQVQSLAAALPRWVLSAAILLTVFLAWLAFSQFGLYLHAVNIRRGGDPLDALRPPEGPDSYEI